MKLFIVSTKDKKDAELIRADDLPNVVIRSRFSEDEIDYIQEVVGTITYIPSPTWIKMVNSNRTMENV